MATSNLKPKNSSDSEGEAEWTFIDTDEGTIETRKDSVTYRKPTYSEILKGVLTEDLVEEVDSEPEFEVLASFKFRPKGESFGVGSSAPKAQKNAETQGKESGDDGDDDDESPNGGDSSSSDDGIMIISSHLTGEDKADETSNIETPSPADNIHNDDDDDFVITDETESDFEEATMDNAAEPDDDENDDEKGKKDVESEEKKLTESTANSLNASTIKDPMPIDKENHDEENNSDSDSNATSDDGFLGIHKGGICDNPEKDLDWDSLTFQLLSALPRMDDSTTTIQDDNQDPKLQDGMIDSIQDSDSESNSHSSYTAVSQDDKQDETSSFDELSDSADVNMDLSSEPMIPRWFFYPDKDIEDELVSFDDDSDYILSDTEELDYDESRLIPQWLFDPSYKVEDVEESVEGDFDFINSDIEFKENDPVIPQWLDNPCYKPKDKDGSFDDDFEEPNPLIPQWFFDPNYKIQDLDETFDDDTDYSDYSDYESESDDDSSIALPRWLFDKNFKPPDQDEEGFSWPSQLFMDIQTFIILLCLTTALGFSIGHGLTMYFSSQSINSNAKLQTMETPAKQFPSPLEDLGLTPEEIARIDLLKLEDELYRQRESDILSDHLRFDLRELYKSLKEKHNRLLRNQKSTENRLHISKTMSWHWRMKYDEEKRRNKVRGFPTNLRLKNFSDMALKARKTKFAKNWRRQYKKNYTNPELGKTNFLNSNLQWLVKKAMALSKNNDMKIFRNRWTQDLKELKDKSRCSHPSKSIHLQKKTAVSSPFTWVNDSRGCKRARRSDILSLCLTKKTTLGKKKKIIPIFEKSTKKDCGRKNNDLKKRPCFSKPKNTNKRKQASKNKVKVSSRKVSQKPRKNSAQRSNTQEKVRRERIEKRELKKKALEIKNQVNELKSVLVELRRERRRAEKEKAKLEASWRKLKRQRLQFEKERKEQKKNNKSKVKKVKSTLTREKTRLKTWKNVAKRAQKKAQTLHKNLKRVSAAKQKLEDIKHIKKDLRLEKRKLRQQQKNLKSIKQQLRKEHRNYARERWKTKKKRTELEKQRFNESKPIEKENKVKKEGKTSAKRKKAKKCQREQPSEERSQHKKKQKGQKKFWENLEKSLYDWAQKVNRTITHHRRGKASKIWKKLRGQFDNLVAWTTRKCSTKTSNKQKKAEKRQTEQPSTKRTQHKKKQKGQKKFWKNVEKSFYDWAQKVNRTIEHHRRGKASKIWKKLRGQFDNLVAWTTGKRSKAKGPAKNKKKHQSKTKIKIKNPVFEKILAAQMRYDEDKKNRQKDSESQWKPRGPVVNKRKNRVAKKKKKETKKNEPDTLRQRQRKQRRKYQRELERLQQYALQMNEKKLEHERIYRKKGEKSRKRFRTYRNPKPVTEDEVAEKRNRFSNSRALASVEDSNNTFMLLLQPQLSKSENIKTPETNRKQEPKYRDLENIIEGVTRSQINHELNKKKAHTSLTFPLEDDVIMPPDDVSKGIESRGSLDVTSLGDESPSSQEPPPPSLSPTFYKDFPILRVINEAKRKKDGADDVEDILSSYVPKGPESSQDDDNGQRSEPWYMRRAGLRDEIRNENPGLTLFPRPIGPFKSDGTWFFHRSSDRALQRELYEPLNRQSARDGFKHKGWRSYFHRGRRRSALNDGEWVFERASDRAEQRSNNEPWYMRRAEGREEDREESKDSWFVERGFDRDMLHDHYDEDYEDDDLMNDYDDYADHDYDEYENSW